MIESLLLHALLSLPVSPVVPAADENPSLPPRTTDEDEEEAPALPPVVVTARGWEEEAQDVPRSMSVLDQPTLQDAGIRTVRDASLAIPNLFLTEFSSRRLSFPTMRGIGSGQGDPAVTTYIGGVPQLTASSTNIPLIDVERVEFLRGPQSTLYGRNALGGVIHIVPRYPSRELEADASASFGNFGHQEYRVMGSGPISGDTIFFKVAGLASERDGFTENDWTGHDVDYRDSFFGRAELLWVPDDRWEVRLATHAERSRDGGFVLSELHGLRARPHHINQDFEGIAARNILAPSLAWTYFGDDVQIDATSAWQDWKVHEAADFDFSPFDAYRRRAKESQRYFNQEVRISSAEDADVRIGDGTTMRWLAGVNLFTADSDRATDTELRPDSMLTPGHDVTRGEFDDWGAAVFGQVTIIPAEDWEVGAGLRLDRESKEADLRHTFNGFPVAPPARLEEDYDEVIPHASVTRHLTDDALAYAHVAKGFKAGGFNLAAPTGRLAFGPETSWTGEIGVKTSWVDEQLHVNVAAFHIDWEDMQLSLFDPMIGGYVDNAGEATSQGFEVELRAEPRSWLDVFGGFGFTDAEYDEYDEFYAGDVSGKSLAFAPETTWNLGTQVTGEPDEQSRWFVRGALHGVGTYYYDAGNTEEESFTLLDLRAGVSRSHWKLEAWVQNALDEEYVQLAFQAGPAFFVGESGAPLTCGFSLTGTY